MVPRCAFCNPARNRGSREKRVSRNTPEPPGGFLLPEGLLAFIRVRREPRRERLSFPHCICVPFGSALSIRCTVHSVDTHSPYPELIVFPVPRCSRAARSRLSSSRGYDHKDRTADPVAAGIGIRTGNKAVVCSPSETRTSLSIW